MRNFRNLLVWQNGMRIAVDTCKMVSELSQGYRYNFGSQMIRSAISIPANIAEGNGRSSDKEKKRFLEIALGSCNELETFLLILQKMQELPLDKINHILNEVEVEQKLLSAFIKKLKANG